jgi:hypothetical protein
VEIKFVAVHEEFRTEDAAVKSSGTMKKRHSGRNLAAGRRGKSKELTKGDYGSRRKLAAASRRMTHSTKVARRRRHDQKNVVQETRKGETLGKRRWKDRECNNGIRDRGLRQQLRDSKRMKD